MWLFSVTGWDFRFLKSKNTFVNSRQERELISSVLVKILNRCFKNATTNCFSWLMIIIMIINFAINDQAWLLLCALSSGLHFPHLYIRAGWLFPSARNCTWKGTGWLGIWYSLVKCKLSFVWGYSPVCSLIRSFHEESSGFHCVPGSKNANKNKPARMAHHLNIPLTMSWMNFWPCL